MFLFINIAILLKQNTAKFLSNPRYVVFIIVYYRDVLRFNFQVFFWTVKPLSIPDNAIIFIQCFASLGSVTMLEFLYYGTLSMILDYTEQYMESEILFMIPQLEKILFQFTIRKILILLLILESLLERQ